MEYFINLLIEWTNSNKRARVERVLWIAPEGNCLYTIEIDSRRAWPIYRRTDELDVALATKIARVLESDPYESLIRPEDQIDAKHRAHRDKYWELIQPLVEAVPLTFQRYGRK